MDDPLLVSDLILIAAIAVFAIAQAVCVEIWWRRKYKKSAAQTN